jgi:hypothetical protein
MPIYLMLVIKGCAFLEKFEQGTQNILQRGALFIMCGLEADAQAELNRPRRAYLRRKPIVGGAKTARRAPIPGIAEYQVWIRHLVMVEKVTENGLELHIDTFCNPYVLFNAEVNVPEGHASQNPGTSSV